MIKRLAAIAQYLEIDANEAKALAQWVGLFIIGAAGVVAAAVILGLAVRTFQCAGGFSC